MYHQKDNEIRAYQKNPISVSGGGVSRFREPVSGPSTSPGFNRRRLVFLSKKPVPASHSAESLPRPGAVQMLAGESVYGRLPSGDGLYGRDRGRGSTKHLNPRTYRPSISSAAATSWQAGAYAP